jgi:hypothetical protein
MTLAADDPQGQARIAAFLLGLQQLDWTDGRNMRIDTRWTAGNADDIRRYAVARVDAIAGPWGVLPNGSQGPPCGITEFWSAARRHKPSRCGAYSRVFQARLCCRKLSDF